MNWLESLIYGLISGISEFLPISSSGHQLILLNLFGIDARDPVRDIFVHIAMLFAVIVSNKSLFELVKREQSVRHRKRHTMRQNIRALRDWRLVQSAVIPLLFSMILLCLLTRLSDNLMITAIFFVVNGLILFIPNRIVQGNKDARAMTPLDSLLIGCSGGVAMFSGISRVGCTNCVAVVRGADKKHALSWSLILSVYALAFICIMDIISIISVGTPDFWRNLYTYIFSGIAAYWGGRLSISMIRLLITRPSNNGFAYYCWGTALFSFILYLTVC